LMLRSIWRASVVTNEPCAFASDSSVRDRGLLEGRFDLCGAGFDIRTDCVAHVAREVHTDHTRFFDHHEIEVLRTLDPRTESPGGDQPEGEDARRWLEGKPHPMAC